VVRVLVLLLQKVRAARAARAKSALDPLIFLRKHLPLVTMPMACNALVLRNLDFAQEYLDVYGMDLAATR
jgi:hypothetical protein